MMQLVWSNRASRVAAQFASNRGGLRRASALLAAVLLTALALPVLASGYDPRVAFAPFHAPQPANRYRASDGRPGPDYWQNRADYQIRVTLDAKAKTLRGHEVIRYTNNSPQALDFLWLRMEQNRYKADSRGNLAAGRPVRSGQHTAGFELDSVEVGSGDKFAPAAHLVNDTRMRIDLAKPLPGHGGVIEIRIAYHYQIPGAWGGRTAWFHSRNGDVIEIAQFYPRMAVYDDLRGWDTLPYLNNEFYLEYGDFDYTVTAPADMLVVGSGKLVNADKVLSSRERARLAKARASDKTVTIRSAAEVEAAAARPAATATKTWHFRMHNSRDVVFAASRAFVWDAARINLPAGKTALAMSAYPVESIADGGWQRATEYVKGSVEEFSRWYPYPWPAAVAVGGMVGGMEYPGVVFDWWKMRGNSLYWVTAHEIGHGWFPMIVGSNERRDAWMDEGFNTFIDVLAADQFNHGEFGPKRDGEYAPDGGNPVDGIVPLLADTAAPAIMTVPDAIKEKYRHPVTYYKAALGLVLLRDVILGPARFDAAFKGYVRAWAFKHPSPSDFFRAMDSAAGEDLGWFWRGWYEHNWQLDLAVTAIAQVGETPAPKSRRRRGPPDQRARVTVANLDKLVMPSVLEVRFGDGSRERIKLPVETWHLNTSIAVAVDGTRRIVSATIDPDHALPDADRGNNTFTAK